MTSLRLSLLFLALWTVSLADNGEQQNRDEPEPTTNTTNSPAEKTDIIISKTAESHVTIRATAGPKAKTPDSDDHEMIQRALYVLIGITAIGVLYFLMRAVRMKKKTVQRKKYGLLSNYDDTMEMGHLESDEDDNTVYEAQSLRR
ncbi:protein FAM174C [Paramisgurnus dabryanus]|uniref:protein FAM174C n=1 Tax=Paramisgurnus dabryanus TaxID=90735 RepID=UPI0031F454F6